MSKELDYVESELPKITGHDYQSPVKFELEIQRQRVLYILHFAINKMKVMAYLPMMLEDDGKILRRFLNSNDQNFVKYVCSKYMQDGQVSIMKMEPSVLKYSTILDNIELNKYDMEEEYIVNSLLGCLDQNRKVDYHISQVVEILTSNEELVNFLKTVPQDQMETAAHTLIECMKHLKVLIHEKLLISSKEQMEIDKRLRVAYKSNFVISESIKRCREQLDKQRKELGSELDKKNAILNAYKAKLDRLKEEFQADIAKEVQKSEKEMMNDAFNSEARQADLEREAQEVSSEYATLLETNLFEENQLRQKRNKVEAQLASWLAKYDNDVGEKQVELEKLEEQYNDMKSKYEELRDDFDEQNKEYQILMNEKKAEERRNFEERAYMFLMNRSARRIQRAWRAYWRRKLERRRKRAKGKSKDKKTKS